METGFSINKLAIVAPIYKAFFLDKVLESLANQTDRRFNVYLGDDASPESLIEIVLKYRNKLNIIYKRFENNLGAKDLVAQWNRCIDMVQDEEYIWFFSDDDIADPNCVELFYKEIEKNGEKDLYRFQTNIIDENGKHIWPKDYPQVDYPNVVSANDYILKRFTYKISSFIVEYIFRRERFNEVGRFQNFDLAWGSDDATWFKMAQRDGINIIEGARVHWRLSDSNISPNRSESILLRKLDAQLNYMKFITDNTTYSLKLSLARYYYWLHIVHDSGKYLDSCKLRPYLDKYQNYFGKNPIGELIIKMIIWLKI